MKEKGIFIDISLIFRRGKPFPQAPRRGGSHSHVLSTRKAGEVDIWYFHSQQWDMGPASYKKVNTLKPQLKRVGRPGKGPRWQRSPVRRRKTLLSWWGLTYGLFAHDSLPPSFSSLWEHVPSLVLWGLTCGSPWWQIPNCDSLLTLRKPHLCWGDTWPSVCFRSMKQRRGKVWWEMFIK